MSRRLALGALSLALLLGSLAACTDVPRIPPPEPAATSTPLFATDQEALEAATAAYEEYLAAVDVLLQDPAGDLNALTAVASGGALLAAEESIQSFIQQGLRTTGPRELTNVVLQRADSDGETVEVGIYVCENVTTVDLLNSDDQSLVEADRPNLTAFEVVLLFASDGSRVDRRDVWVGGGVC